MNRSLESRPDRPTAGATSKRATVPPRSAGETREDASAYEPVLTFITADEAEHALDLFPPAPQPAAPPKVDDDDGDLRTQRWLVPLVAAALTAVVLIGVTISALLMRRADVGRIATLNVQPTELAMPAIQTAARAVDTFHSNPTTPPNGERPPSQAAPSSISPRSRAALPSSERPVQPVSLPGSFTPPLPNLEAIGTPSLGTLDTSLLPMNFSVEVKGIVPEPATPAVPPTAMPAPPSETGAIQGVLGRYQTAFNELDAGAAGAIWPSLDTKALRRAFEQLEEQNLVFDTCQIAVRDARAVASCGGTAWYVPRVGNKTVRGDWRQWEFNLRKIDDVWLIDTVSAR